MKKIFVAALAAAALTGCGLDNLQTSQGQASFLFKEARWYRNASIYGTQVGPTSTGFCWAVSQRSFPITQQPHPEQFTIMVADDIPLTFEATLTERPRSDEESIIELVNGWGTDYYQRTMREAFRTTVHEVVSQRNSRDVKTVREELAQQIKTKLVERLNEYEKALQAANPDVYRQLPFEVVAVNIGNIDYPQRLQTAIAKTRELEKELERKGTEMEITAKKVDRQIAEAESIAERMSTLSEGMDRKYLDKIGIEVAKTLTESPNETVIILPTKPGAPGVPYLDFSRFGKDAPAE